MFDIQASLLLTQLEKLEMFWARRRSWTARLDAGLAGVAEIMRPVDRSGIKNAHHLYVVWFRTEDLTADRDTIMNAIQAENVGIGVHFRAVHLHPYYRERWGFRPGMFPLAEYYSERTLSLPLFPAMTEGDVDDVVAAVRKVIGHFRA